MLEMPLLARWPRYAFSIALASRLWLVVVGGDDVAVEGWVAGTVVVRVVPDFAFPAGHMRAMVNCGEDGVGRPAAGD